MPLPRLSVEVRADFSQEQVDEVVQEIAEKVLAELKKRGVDIGSPPPPKLEKLQ